MVEKKIISEVVEMVKDIPGKDILVPLAQEEKELAPYPKVQYTIVEAPTMDKLVRDVNTHLANGRVCDGGVQVSSGPIIRFYQSMERWNVDIAPEPEMPSEKSEAGCQGTEPLRIPGLEDEPDLYEDINKDDINGETDGQTD